MPDPAAIMREEHKDDSEGRRPTEVGRGFQEFAMHERGAEGIGVMDNAR